MSLRSSKSVLLSAFSAVILLSGISFSAQAQEYPFRTRIYEDFNGLAPSWKPKDLRTRPEFWFPHMRSTVPAQNYYSPVDNDDYVDCNPCDIQGTRRVYKGTQRRLTVIDADIPRFERQRPLPYRRY